MEARAKAKFLRITARKMRLIADLVRGQNAKEAEQKLKFTPKRGARMMAKIIHSAISNAEERGDVDTDNLFIKTVFVNEGPTHKRFLPRARGSASPIFKRTSHVEMILEER